MKNKDKTPKKSKNKGLKKLGRGIFKFFYGIYKIFDILLITPITRLFLWITKPLKNNKSPIDRLFSNKLFLIVLSLSLTFIVFVNLDTMTESMRYSSADVLYKQTVTALYNEEAYVVEGLPETVDITLIGRRADLYLAKQYPSKEVVVDLRGLKAGSHKVSLKYSGSVASVDYKLDPSTASIIIYEKISMSKNLSSEILNEDKLSAKFNITNVTFSRDEVYVKGAEYKLKQVAVVKALIDMAELTDPSAGTTTIKEVPLVAYDKDGNKLDVEIVPAVVDAKLEITSPSKEVPLKVVPEGTPVFGKAIDSITTSRSTITIYGDESVLSKISYVPVKIDVNDLNSNQEYNVNITKPTGVKDMSVTAVVVKVTLNNVSEKTIDGVSISPKNLSTNLIVTPASQKDASASIIVKGSTKNLSTITKDNITASVDLTGLGVGTHEVSIEVTGDDLKLTYTPKTKTVTLVIKKK